MLCFLFIPLSSGFPLSWPIANCDLQIRVTHLYVALTDCCDGEDRKGHIWVCTITIGPLCLHSEIL